jgi:IS30 family transposase
VAQQLRLNWSPEQIAGWLKRAYPGEEANQVSHETIYRSLFVQTRGVLKKELMQHLRSQRTMRHSRHGSGIKDMISIRERPASVEDRAVPGHWEGDLLSGPKDSYIVTLVERHTRYVMLAKVADKRTQTVVTALIRQAKKLPSEHRGVLLRSAKPVAARFQREHQPPAPAVLPEGHRLICTQPGASE